MSTMRSLPATGPSHPTAHVASALVLLLAINSAYTQPRGPMGLIFSRRVGSDPYYANYEKSFERLEKECVKLTVRCGCYVLWCAVG